MKLVKLLKHGSLTSILIIILTGCVSFPKNQLPTADLQKIPEGSKKPSVSYTFTSGVDIIIKQEHSERERKILENEFVEALNESGYFSSVSSSEQCELNIQVRLVNSGLAAAAIPAFITGLSLMIIPSWATDHYDTTVKVQTLNKQEYNYTLTDSIVTVRWLPLIVMLPFKNPAFIYKEVRKNIWKNLIIKMQKDGLLPPPLSTSHTTLIIKFSNSENT